MQRGRGGVWPSEEKVVVLFDRVVVAVFDFVFMSLSMVWLSDMA